MSRTSRVPYHQNVYDLLQLVPGDSLEAARMIAEHESVHGPLPASLREWYLVPNVVALDTPDGGEDVDYVSVPGTLWHDYLPHDMGSRYHTPTLADVLRGCASGRVVGGQPAVVVLINWGYCTWTWIVRLTGSDDPPVYITPHDMAGDPVKQYPVRFSQFVWTQFVAHYRSEASEFVQGAKGAPVVHSSGLWLRAPAEPFAPPVIDFLTEQLGEPERTPRPGDVTTYTFRPAGGTIRVTADDPSLTGGLSAWWVHAESADRLTELGRLLMPWGTLRDTLRADTEPARQVLAAVK